MPTPLTANIARTATQFEVTAGNLDFVGKTVTVQVQLLTPMGGLVETITKTRTFADIGITDAQADAIKTRLVTRLKTEGDIN